MSPYLKKNRISFFLGARHSPQDGSVILLALLFILVVSLTIFMAQSRLLLSERRERSGTDAVISAYGSESEVNDLFTRITDYDEPLPADTTFTNEDGIEIRIQTSDDPSSGIKTLTITGQLPYAANQIIGEIIPSEILGPQKIEITFVLDCSTSMNEDAGDGRTKVEALEDAMVKFINDITLRPDADTFRLGMIGFSVDSVWMVYGGQDIKPDNSLSLAEVKQAVIDGYGSTVSSPNCSGVVKPNTNIGAGLHTAYEFWGTKPSSAITKRVVILITDGIPNARMPNTNCPTSNSIISPELAYCAENANPYPKPPNWSNFTGNCDPYGIEYSHCALANTSQKWNQSPALFGICPPDVDLFSVVVGSLSSATVRDHLDIDTDDPYNYSRAFFPLAQATELSSALDDILELLVGPPLLQIRKEIPQ